MKFIEKFEKIDRRIIFLLILIAVLVPLIRPFNLSIKPSPPVENIYNYVEALPEGSVIWVSYDYYLSTTTECDAQINAFLKHAFRKNHKVFVTSLIADGQQISQINVEKIAKQYNKKYGKDYVILGYKPGGSIVIMQVCKKIKEIYPCDINGTPLDEIPMMKNVHSASDISMAFTSTDNASIDGFVAVANTQFHIPLAGGSTAVSVPLLYVYVNSGQVMGILGGLKGAAEYETLLNQPETGTAGMGAQSVVHAMIVLMILISNIFYFIGNYYKNKA